MKKTIYQSRYLRILVPAILALVWLGIGGIGGPQFGKLSKIVNNDQASYLPASADSTKVIDVESKYIGGKVTPAIVLFESGARFGKSSAAYLLDVRTALARAAGLATSGPTNPSVVGPIVSQDGHAVEYILQLPSNTDTIKTTVKQLRTSAAGFSADGLKGYVTGPAGILSDLFTAFSGIDSTLLYVALAAVFIILILVYRSVILPFLVILTAVMALSGAGLVVHYFVTAGWLKLNAQSQGILSILVIGAATDYSLLIIARYHEALGRFKRKSTALVHALRMCLEPVAASAATVTAGVLCLLFSQLNSNRSLGPVSAIGIVFAFLSAMTFLPLLLLVFGRWAFWPRQPRVLTKEQISHARGLWHAVPQFISRHYRLTWVACFILLGIVSLAVPQFKANGVSQTDAIRSHSDAVDGEKVLARHFPAGSGSPAVILIDPLKLKSDLAAIVSVPGIASAQPVPSPVKTGPDGKPLPMYPAIIDNWIIVNATLNVPADSSAGQQVVKSLREQLAQVDSKALVGGTTAVSLDTNTAATADLHQIVPIVLIVILLILMALLRSVFAPLLLIGSVILSFATTIGGSALVFNHIFHFPGSDAAIPLFGFIFLVALGVDYNIFLMTRVREESSAHGTRPGIMKGLSVTGAVITSAGIVLAATFAALGIIPVLFLVQIAFIVTSGVLVDTLVVRSLLVPALCYDLDQAIWWPSKKMHRRTHS